ncbi:hypothetical protein [Nonomuraea typhae]|uniref:DUF2157 domain-containing protein n=1 Tax=Nonomuraea typhae TaxID=2603600 RepID=A0ABW7YRT3_9ACTN
MNLLERRYRNVLRLLPASYRAGREEEMVAAYMEYAGDVPDELSPRPRFGEIASVAGLALRVRLAGATGAPRYFAWGETVRMTALFGLAFHAMLGVTGVIAALMLEPPVDGVPTMAERLADLGNTLAGVLWLVSFAALARGAAPPAKIAGGAAALWSLAERGTQIATWGTALEWDGPFLLLILVPALALLAGFHRDAPPPRRSWWVALGAPVLAGSVPILVNLGIWRSGDPARFQEFMVWTDVPGLLMIAVLAAGLVCLVRRAGAPPLLALAWYALLALLCRLPNLTHVHGEVVEPWLAGQIQCAILAVSGLTLAVTGWRRLPVLDRLRERSG